MISDRLRRPGVARAWPVDSPAAPSPLLRAGEALGGRKLGRMGWVARDAFSRFNDEEIEAVYIYLNERRRSLREQGR